MIRGKIVVRRNVTGWRGGDHVASNALFQEKVCCQARIEVRLTFVGRGRVSALLTHSVGFSAAASRALTSIRISI